jgi:glycosyltransferase involved in cell wall biosynthesis
MLISIVIPVLNQAKYIEEALLSVLNQPYPQKELIVVDGGSTDGTLEIIKKYHSRFAYWISEPDKGQADAIQKGLANAHGEIVNWLNADDYLLPNSLSVLAELFTDPKVEVVCAQVKRQNEQGFFEQEISQTLVGKNAEQTLVWTSMGQPGQFYRRPIWKALQGLDTRFHYSMDKELWCRYILANGQLNVKISDQAVAVFRLHQGSKTANFQSRFQEEDKRIQQMIHSSNSQKVNLKRVKAYGLGKEALNLYEQGEYAHTRTKLWNSFKLGAWDGPGFLVCFLKVLLLPPFVINNLRSSPPKGTK